MMAAESMMAKLYPWHQVAAVSGKPTIYLSFSVYIHMREWIWRRAFVKIIETGAVGIGLGAFGAHVFKPQNPIYKEVCFYPFNF